MSALRLHTASAEDLDRLWPTLRSTHLFPSREDLVRFHASGPWRVLIGSTGRAALLARWRDHLGILAVRGLWCSEHEVGDAMRQLRDTAARQGFDTLLSPLLVEAAAAPYLSAGLSVRERIVAFRANARGIEGLESIAPRGITLRKGVPADIANILRLDARCFDDFWRYGPKELSEYMSVQRVVVAECSADLVGYTLCTVEEGCGTLGRLAVDSVHRRRGVGFALLVEALGWMVRIGAGAVSLCTQEANEASRALYASAGLKEQRERLLFLQCPTGLGGSSRVEEGQ
ncbi:MAG: GNAT family N-acetyltransferase [Coriobacteriia bacterium]|nr:GNAT family N-acetyltransferase [Coriobacteriia bacterium]